MKMKYTIRLKKTKEQKERTEKRLLESIKQLIPQEPRAYDINDDPGFWQKEDKILCPSNIECEVIAEFFRDMLTEFGCMEVFTGQDVETGFCFIKFK